jgi:hypothetical protein
VRDQVSHPYSTTGKIAVLYILIFRFLTVTQFNQNLVVDNYKRTGRHGEASRNISHCYGLC